MQVQQSQPMTVKQVAEYLGLAIKIRAAPSVMPILQQKHSSWPSLKSVINSGYFIALSHTPTHQHLATRGIG
jgi:hypothetical protein